MLQMLERELPDTALLTISFHPGLEALHHRKIELIRVPQGKKLFDRDGSAAAFH
jgi:ABC-type uncharacterized transport system fused permease/ATPase subunit